MVLPESFLLNFRQRTDAVTLFIEESTIRAVEVVGAEVMAEVVSASPLALILMTALVMTMGLLVEAEDRCSSL